MLHSLSQHVPTVCISAISSFITSYCVVKPSNPRTMAALLTLTHSVSKIASDYFYMRWAKWGSMSYAPKQFTKTSFRLLSIAGVVATTKVIHYLGQKSNLDMPSFLLTLGMMYCNKLISSMYEHYYEILTINVFPLLLRFAAPEIDT